MTTDWVMGELDDGRHGCGKDLKMTAEKGKPLPGTMAKAREVRRG
jgi:hypothetical protein